ncbi:branched-chain amino acid transporter [Collibacillus ludicampi]|uniref:Branched-chain amino acid transporter n=1 Tax=Collibacillus ludicampi TaxID=2771369 RepID=A0AAV4LK10_9BACL|nr:AzlD domain-containing protein [Collibacillus ludicampi]GIM48123.1 branched-chain amino acid transporter [Collibacillus ludicampi]
MKHLWLLVIGMGLVTYLPRMLPMVLLQHVRFPPFLNRFFQLIPFAALGALIFPGILSSTGSIASSIAGGVLSVVLAFFRANVMAVVLVGIMGAFFWKMVIG